MQTASKVLKTILKTCLLLLLLIFIGGGLFAAWQVHEVIKDAPVLDVMAVSPSEAATYIYNQDGKRVQKLTLPEANRDLVTIDHIPADLQHAFVAIEDSRFYSHNGIDIPGIARAFVKGITSGSFSEGASTITQQLLKNSIFTDWTTQTDFIQRLRRKIQEQYLALKLEKMLTKDQILEDYLNTINLGAGCYGVQAAAYRYFGKDVSELTLSESTVIAGITQNPTRYNPLTSPEENASRRRTILEYMLRQGYITQQDMAGALADDVYSRIHSNDESIDSSASIYTYYQDALIDQVLNDLMNEKGYTYKQAYKAVYTGGLRIYSAQDDAIQQICDEEFENPANFPSGTQVGIDYALSIQSADGEITHYGNESLRAYVRASGDSSFDLMYDNADAARASAAAFRAATVKETDTVLGERITVTPQPQASVVVIDQATGLVKAIVGGRGTKDASLTLNRATYTTRQPGSTFKILTAYAPAMDAFGKTLATKYENGEYFYEGGQKVSNWDLNGYTDPVTIREAIEESINVAAVECITEITPRVGFEYAKAFGISTLVDSYQTDEGTLTDMIQPLALGGITHGVTNLELCGAYACIANLGKYIAPKFYTQVLDQYGNTVLDNSAPAQRTVIKESTAYLLTDAMRGVITKPDGTAYETIDLGYMPVAGKTGTTSDYRDIWFAGYTPYYTCSIWCGYDNNRVLPEQKVGAVSADAASGIGTAQYTGLDPDLDIGHNFNKVLWNSIMNRIHEDLNVTAFRAPTDIVRMRICNETGKAAAPGCTSFTEELFAAGTQPAYYCSRHGDGSLVPASAIMGLTGSPYTGQTGQGQTGNAGQTLPGAGSQGSQGTGVQNGQGAGTQTQTQDDVITIYTTDEASIPAPEGNVIVIPDQPGGQTIVLPDNSGSQGAGSSNAGNAGGQAGYAGYTGGQAGYADNPFTGTANNYTNGQYAGQPGNGSGADNSGLSQEVIEIYDQIPEAH